MQRWKNDHEAQDDAAAVSHASEGFVYDVIVVGLGTAGSIAAIAAAKKGMRVLGVERHTGMGGTGAAGGVLNYYFGSRGGFFERIDQQVMETVNKVYTPALGISAEGKQYVLEQEASQAGVTLRYETTVIGVLMNGNTVTGIECFSPDTGRCTFYGSVVIDSTGNADVCRLAGCELRSGREFDGQTQPFSNVLFRMEPDRVCGYYTDSGYVHPQDPVDMSQAIINSALLPTHLKGIYDEHSAYFRVAPLLGIRESQTIIGEENVTLADFLEDRYTRQPVFMAHSNLDSHSKDVALESSLQQDWTVAASLWGMKFTVPVPLGALIPKGYDGLLVAGRCLAVDHEMAACIRMKRDMQKCGEAAGYAAYLAVTKQIPLRDVPYAELVPLLRETGCLSEREVYFEQQPANSEKPFSIIHWLTDMSAIKDGLSGEKPGVAIWSVRRLGRAAAPYLYRWIGQDENEHLRKHSAIALAILDDMTAAPILREMVKERDPFTPRTSWRYNQTRGYAAIYLLGRLADPEAIPDLISLLTSKERFFHTDHNTVFIADEHELRFQYISHTLLALARIGDRYAAMRPEIMAAFERCLAGLDQTLSITFIGSSSIRVVMDDKIRSIISRIMSRWTYSDTDAQ